MLNKQSTVRSLIYSSTFLALLGFSSASRAADEFETMSKMVNLMDSFFELMDSVYSMNADNEKAALLQMHEIEEIYKEQGQHKQAIRVYEQVLQRSKNPTIRNIAYHRMADVMKENGDLNGAVNILNQALEESLKRTR